MEDGSVIEIAFAIMIVVCFCRRPAPLAQVNGRGEFHGFGPLQMEDESVVKTPLAITTVCLVQLLLHRGVT